MQMTFKIKQYFRGSNNRLNGNKRDRANNNRLFDSQNNNRGGYNVGRNPDANDIEEGIMKYYEKSKLQLEWLVHLNV